VCPSDARLPPHGGGRWALAESTDVVTAWTVVKRDVVMCDGHRAALLAHPARGIVAPSRCETAE